MKQALLVLALAALLTACSSRGWYEELQRFAQRQCLADREECGELVSYEQYERERERALDRD